MSTKTPEHIEITVGIRPDTLHLGSGTVVDVYGSNLVEETLDRYYADIVYIRYNIESVSVVSIVDGGIRIASGIEKDQLKVYIDTMLMPIGNHICGNKNGLIERFYKEARFDADGYKLSDKSQLAHIHVTLKISIENWVDRNNLHL